MPFCSTPAIRFSLRILTTFNFLAKFSSSCALKTVDLVEESYANTHDCSYNELHNSMRKYAALGNIRQALYNLNLMRNISGKPTVYDFNTLMYFCFKSHSVPSNELVDLYHGMKSFGPAPNSLTFNTLVNGLVSVGYVKDAIIIVEEMCSCGFVPSFLILSKLLKKSLQLGMLVDSLIGFEVMLRFGYVPTQPSFNMLICMLSKAGMIHEAYLVFSSLLGKGCFFGIYTFNPILWALCKSNQSHTALRLFYWMKKSGIEMHNVCSYTALVYGFCREGFWEDAFRCLDEMQDIGCQPNVITYTVVVKFLCDNGRTDEALSVLCEMEKEKYVTDMVIYNVFLHELSQRDREADISELIEIINIKGISPDLYSLATVAGGLLKKGKVGIAYGLLLDAFSNRYGADVALYNIYFNCLCRLNRSREALILLKSMMERGFKPNNVSYNTILAGICKAYGVHKAFKLLHYFKWDNNGPDVVSFNTILSLACKQQNSEMIRRVLHLMECKGIKHDIVTANCLIQYFCTVRKFSECLKILETMMHSGPNPNIFTFNMVLDKLCKNGLLGTAHSLFSHCRNSGLLPNTVSYSILIHASRREQNHFLVDQLLRDMHKQGLKLDVYT